MALGSMLVDASVTWTLVLTARVQEPRPCLLGRFKRVHFRLFFLTCSFLESQTRYAGPSGSPFLFPFASDKSLRLLGRGCQESAACGAVIR